MSQNEISIRLLEFIRVAFLEDDAASEVDGQTPLLEWGILNSMNTAILLTFIRDELGNQVPPAMINAKNFKNVDSITAMVLSLQGSELAQHS